MRLETKIATLLMFAALVMSSCTKKPHTTEEPAPSSLGFRAMSQAVWVKSDEAATTTTPMFPYDDFGVWGIARQGTAVYNLWGNSGLSEVKDLEKRVENNITTSTTPRVFTPTEAAYWLNGYSYNFLAVAPYADAGFTFNGVTTKEAQTSVTNPSDYLTFTYDMSSKYTAGDYDFDLLGAAGQNTISTSGYSTAQDLKFWHMFSKINIGVSFSKDLAGEPISGRLTKITLKDVYTEGQYILSQSSTEIPSVRVTCPVSTDASKVDLEYVIPTTSTVEESNASGSTPTFTPDWTFYVIPQLVKNMGLYLDFEINEGSSTDPDWVEYNNIRINLDVEKNQQSYTFNGNYNWKITIGTGAAIKFEISVIDWTDATDDDFDSEIDM